jgi:uncharacterized protein YjiS (DUF1127 family)
MVFVSSILNYLRQEREFRATSKQLHAMDDHLLADIGLRRDQINTLVAEQRKNKRTQAAAEAQNKRKTQTSGATLGGNGLAAQH